MFSVINLIAQNFEISKEDFPKNSLEFLEKHFPELDKQVVSYFIEFERDVPRGRIEDYEVHLCDGTIVEFNKNGLFENIECHNGNHVPTSILPEFIKKFLKKYKIDEKKIISYSIEKHNLIINHEIELNNGTDFLFNKTGKLIE
jgi:hypothetical protein